ncbi:MAG: hypothetical protein V4654_14610 [Bdellovibrionota bacterium]
MKHQQAPKWLLTTALLAVLGANYGFQASSLALHKDNGLIELSSETSGGTGSRQTGGGKSTGAPSPTVTTNAPPASKTAVVSQTATVSATAAVSATVQAKPLPQSGKPEVDNKGKEVNFKHEGKVLATGTCADESCKSVILNMSTLEKFAANLVSATSKLAPTTQVAASVSAAAVVADADYDCDFTEDDKPETRAQKRDRLKCVKQEKERVKKEERIAKFEDKMDDIKDRCEVTTSETKLECLTREFNNAVTRYSGRNAIPANVAQRYFKNVVGAELSKMLFNADVTPQQAMSLLQDVFDGLPSEYSTIRQNILSAIQNETKTRSQAINQQYKLAETLKNKPQEYLQTVGEAQAAQTELAQMVDVYSAAARTSDAFSEDTSFSRYYLTRYMPEMRSLFAGMGPQGSTGTTTTPDQIDNPTRANTRGGTTTPSAGTRGAATTTTKVGTPSPTQWEFSNNSGGVRVGSPSSTSNGGTRGARSMGN